MDHAKGSAIRADQRHRARTSRRCWREERWSPRSRCASPAASRSPASQNGGVDTHLVDLEHSSLSLESHRADLHRRPGGRAWPPSCGYPRTRPTISPRTGRWRARHHRAQRALRRRRARGGAGGEVSSARRAPDVGRPAAPAVPLFSGPRGQRGAQRGDHSDRPGRKRGGRRTRPRRSPASRASTWSWSASTICWRTWGWAGSTTPRVREAYARPSRPAAATASIAASAASPVRAELVAEFVRLGARYVSTGTDLGFLIGACAAKAKQVRDIAL